VRSDFIAAMFARAMSSTKMKSIVAEPSPWMIGRLPWSMQSSQRTNTSV
jgi:hypothetical protein